MRQLAHLTAALAFGPGTTAALAEDAPGAKSDITIVESTPSAGDEAGTAGEIKR
jgi:hypothetical protein